MTLKHLGRYELLEQLGEGGMGAVWLARLSGTAGFEKLCIVKTVLPSIAKDAEFVSRFLHEGRVLTQLTHGNIAQVLDMDEADGQLFLALEYVAGVDLARLAEQVRAANEFMPTSLVVAMIAQAAEGLGAAHRKVTPDGTPLNVVHRDVSPQNIMVSYEGEVKIIDFGIAKSEARSRHTAQASVMGKLGYMAPEQARGESVDHRADQYALGIVLWELLANQPFVNRGTLTEMVVAMATPRIRPLSPLRPDVPASLEAVVLRALAPLPDARFPDTDAFARALTGELLALGSPPGKQQLGEYVKARCAQEFSSQRQLISRIATVRAIGGTGVATATATAALVSPTLISPGALAPTAQHPAVDETAPVPAALTAPARPSVISTAAGLAEFKAEPALTTGELQAATKRSPLPVILAAAVVLVLGAAVAFTFLGTTAVSVVDAGVAPKPVVVVPPVEVAAVEPPEPVEPFDAGPMPISDGPIAPAVDVEGHLGAGNVWLLSNRESRPLTRCHLTVPGQRTFAVGSLPPKATVQVPASLLRFNGKAAALADRLEVDCTEGVAVSPTRP